jgi:hypothetical protein
MPLGPMSAKLELLQTRAAGSHPNTIRSHAKCSKIKGFWNPQHALQVLPKARDLNPIQVRYQAALRPGQRKC